MSQNNSDVGAGHLSASKTACRTLFAQAAALSHRTSVVSSFSKRFSKIFSRFTARSRQAPDYPQGHAGCSVSFPTNIEACGQLSSTTSNVEFKRPSFKIHGSSDSLLPVLGATPPNGCSPPGGSSPMSTSSLSYPYNTHNIQQQQTQYIQCVDSPFKTFSNCDARSSDLPSPAGCEAGAVSHSVGHSLLSCLSGNASGSSPAENLLSHSKQLQHQLQQNLQQGQQQQQQQPQRSWSHLFTRTRGGQPQQLPSSLLVSSPIPSDKPSSLEIKPSDAPHDHICSPRHTPKARGRGGEWSPPANPGRAAGPSSSCLPMESPAVTAATAGVAWNTCSSSVRQMQTGRPSTARLLAYRAPEVLSAARGSLAALQVPPQSNKPGPNLHFDVGGDIDSGRCAEGTGSCPQQPEAAALLGEGSSGPCRAGGASTLSDLLTGIPTVTAAAPAAAAPAQVRCMVWRQGPTQPEKSLVAIPFSEDARGSSQPKPPAAFGSETSESGLSPSSAAVVASSSPAPSAKMPIRTTTALLTSARGRSPVPAAGCPCGHDVPYARVADPAPTTDRILALCPGLPPAMKRAYWSLDDYKILRRLYKGSTSAVYKAICTRSGLPVALKVYFLQKVPEAVLHMVCREVEIHSSILHPNIIMLYAAFMSEKHLTLVMEYAAQGDLLRLQDAIPSRRMDEQNAADNVLRPLMDAVVFLHRHGVCHRDIKPENVLFTSDWQLKLADFGVSINLVKERAVTRAGTECYMAPEVARCPLKIRPEDNKHNRDLSYGTACDIWAVGVLAYELLVGFTPLRPGPLPEQPAAAKSSRHVLIFPGGTTCMSRDFVARCLAERPEDRPSAHELCRHPWLATRKAASALVHSGPPNFQAANEAPPSAKAWDGAASDTYGVAGSALHSAATRTRAPASP